MSKLELSFHELTRPFRLKESDKAPLTPWQEFLSRFKLDKPNKTGQPISLLASREADAASSNGASVSAGVNDPLKNKMESAGAKSNGQITFRSRFLESKGGKDDTGTRFKVALLLEGMGNFNDGYFYTKDALESAVSIFEGKKIYADHPSAIDEQTRPERSVKDILGHFEDVHIEESEDGQSQLVGDVCILPEEPYQWARALMTHSVDYAQKYPSSDFVGLSINASGDAQPMPIDKMLETDLSDSIKQKLLKAKNKGIETIKLVSVITEAVSCDLVTEAGAGGKVLEMLEKEKAMAKKVKESEAKEKKEKGSVAAAPADEKDPSKQKAEGADGAAPAKKAPPAASGDEGSDDSDDGDETHDDEDQDKALIQKMIAQYLGKDDVSNEEVMKMCKEAYEAYKEMGYKEEEAMEAAGHSMKLAKHMASKKAEAKEHEEHHENEGGDQPPLPKKKAAPSSDGSSAPDTEDAPVAPSNKESKVVVLKAEVAALKERLNKVEIEKHLDKVLRESGMNRATTQKFKESIGTPKSIKEIDNNFKIFVEAYKAARGSETDGFGFVISTEKRTAATSKVSFEDCAE